MLQKIDKERLDKVLQVIELQKIRFPVAEISKRTHNGNPIELLEIWLKVLVA